MLLGNFQTGRWPGPLTGWKLTKQQRKLRYAPQLRSPQMKEEHIAPWDSSKNQGAEYSLRANTGGARVNNRSLPSPQLKDDSAEHSNAHAYMPVWWPSRDTVKIHELPRNGAKG